VSDRVASRARIYDTMQFHSGLIVVCSLLLLLLCLGIYLDERFSRLTNLLNIAEQSTDLVLVSLGQTLTILAGGIDLSVGSTISLIACLASGLINGDPSRVLPVVAALLVLAATIGCVNALLVIGLRVHPLIVTLGTGAVLQGGTLLYAHGPIGKVPPSYSEIAYGRIVGLPFGTVFSVSLYMLVALALRFLPLGRYIYAVGDDANAAGLLGLPKSAVTLLVYGMSGLCAGLTGLYLVARFGVGQPYTGANYTLASITPVIVGGTLLSGGRGGVVGTFVGALLIGLLNNILNFMDVSKQIQLIAQAIIIIAAVSVYVERKRAL
jgi:ribose transport system permease protein